MVIGGKNYFSAGFDVKWLANPKCDLTSSKRYIDDFHRAFEAGPKPVVAAMADTAVGGGCELAIACNGRVCTMGTSIGLPEARIGILPGTLIKHAKGRTIHTILRAYLQL